MQLRSAAVRRSDGGAPQRLVQAVNYVQACAAGTNNNTEPTVPEGGVGGCAATLQGTWLLAVTFRGGAGEKKTFSFAPTEAQQQLELSTPAAAADGAADGAAEGAAASARGGAAGTFERLAPGSGPGLYRTRGPATLETQPAARASASGADFSGVVIRLEAEECKLGPLPVPNLSPSSRERVLLLDRTLCVCESVVGDVSVWVRPTLKADPDEV